MDDDGHVIEAPGGEGVDDPDNGDVDDTLGEEAMEGMDDEALDDGLLDGGGDTNLPVDVAQGRSGGGLRASSPGEAASDEEISIVHCATSAGPITLHLRRSWSPHGYDKASSLFERGYYDRSHFFRVVPHFLVQFGISYTQDVELKRFADASVPDDPKRSDLMPFKEGYVSFAGSGPNSRTSQLFFAYDKAQGLGGSPWETPIGEVVEGMETVRNFYGGYGDMPPWGKGPQQGPIRNQGSKYIEENFPLLDKFDTCTVKRASSLAEGEGAVEGVRSGEEASPVKPTPRRVKQEEVADSKFPLVGKIAVVAILSVILGGALARRKKKKQAGKHV